jgi:hypothetical protein
LSKAGHAPGETPADGAVVVEPADPVRASPTRPDGH